MLCLKNIIFQVNNHQVSYSSQINISQRKRKRVGVRSTLVKARDWFPSIPIFFFVTFPYNVIKNLILPYRDGVINTYSFQFSNLDGRTVVREGRPAPKNVELIRLRLSPPPREQRRRKFRISLTSFNSRIN